jgi:NADPH:quinone reductase-like Zn-dependent oxidoreductase
MFVPLLSSVLTVLQFLVWAGSTGVGMYAIKLASLLGYRVVTTASLHNFELVKSLGASAVFDYKDPDVSTKIQGWVKDQNIGPLTKGLDTISESKDSTAANGAVIGSSIKLSLQAFGDSEGMLVTLCTLPLMSMSLVRLTGNNIGSASGPGIQRRAEGPDTPPPRLLCAQVQEC